MTSANPRLSTLTAQGSNEGNFSPADWAMVAASSVIWGSSYLWMAIGLDNLHPGVIAFGRMLFGSLALGLNRSARRPIERRDWGVIAAIAVSGNAAPAVLFPTAQQYVESSVAGMLNSIGPIFVLIISVVMTRRMPNRIQLLGLFIGLFGTLVIAYPNVVGADAQPLGVVLVLLAVFGYSISNNLMPPVAQRYGGPAVILRALMISSVLLVPFGMWGAQDSTADATSIGAVIILGIFGTGIARSIFANLTASVGATRSSIVSYLVPIVAVALGIIVRHEKVGWVEIVGTALVLTGAWLISRGKTPIRRGAPSPARWARVS